MKLTVIILIALTVLCSVYAQDQNSSYTPAQKQCLGACKDEDVICKAGCLNAATPKITDCVGNCIKQNLTGDDGKKCYESCLSAGPGPATTATMHPGKNSSGSTSGKHGGNGSSANTTGGNDGSGATPTMTLALSALILMGILQGLMNYL